MDDKQTGLSPPDAAERLRLEQLDMLAQLFQVMIFAGLITLGFLYWIFSSSHVAIGWVAPFGVLVITYGAVFCIGHSWRRRASPLMRAEMSVGYMRCYVGTVLLLGSLWAILLPGLNGIADDDQRSILYATTGGIISAAGVLQPMRVAFAFWAPVTFGASLMLAQTGRFLDLQIFGLLMGYSPLILFTALFINRTLVRRVTHEARLQDQADVIGLLLRDFEANSSHWLWETDGELRLKNVSPRFADIAQTPAELLANRSIFELLQVNTLLAGVAAPGPVVQQLQARSAFANLVVPVDVAGQPRWWSLTGRPTFNRSNSFVGFRGVGADVTEATQDARRTAYLASYDSLTGLANRVVFQRALEDACADAAERRSAVLYLDLDGFKQVNDTLGHATGDALLFAVAQRIRNSVREGDVAARLGGDEFAILMQGASEQAAALLAQRVLEGVSHPVFLEGHRVEVRVSIGIALSMPGVPPAAWLDNADRALYQAKTGGRGTYRLFARSPAHEQLGQREDRR